MSGDRLLCPKHGIYDCSPLLNGCSWNPSAAFREPPSGWLTYGSHYDNQCGVDGILTFSDERGADGFPLWERHDGCRFLVAAPSPVPEGEK